MPRKPRTARGTASLGASSSLAALFISSGPIRPPAARPPPPPPPLPALTTSCRSCPSTPRAALRIFATSSGRSSSAARAAHACARPARPAASAGGAVQKPTAVAACASTSTSGTAVRIGTARVATAGAEPVARARSAGHGAPLNSRHCSDRLRLMCARPDAGSHWRMVDRLHKDVRPSAPSHTPTCGAEKLASSDPNFSSSYDPPDPRGLARSSTHSPRPRRSPAHLAPRRTLGIGAIRAHRPGAPGAERQTRPGEITLAKAREQPTDTPHRQRLQLEICEHPTVACKNTPISSCIVDNAGYKPLPCREGRQPRPRQRVAAPPLRRCRARRQGARRATLARPWQQPVSSFFRLETHRGAGALSLLARRRAVACRLPATARRMSVANRVRARPRAPC